ncbi:MAG: glycosyltransferase, partial [Planctomycetota bacterium]|nr:glycosyltransferase [Planctomycetota bacterium]
TPIEAAFFTHIEEFKPKAESRFFEVSRWMDSCVCMAQRYVDRIKKTGHSNVVQIRPGVDTDYYAPRLRIGVFGRTYHTGRKGEALVKSVLDLEGVEWVFTGEGWPGEGGIVPEDQLPSLYRSLDYLLVPAHYEGGPMSALESLACGTPVISSAVGFMEDYPHIPFSNGDADSLRKVLLKLLDEKKKLSKSVADTTWDTWASQHDRLFCGLVHSAKKPILPLAGQTKPLKVLLAIHPPENTRPGGPSVRVKETAVALRKIGYEVDVSNETHPVRNEYDLVHAFNVCDSEEALSQLRFLKGWGIPVIFSPIFMDLRETKISRKSVSRAVLFTKNVSILRGLGQFFGWLDFFRLASVNLKARRYWNVVAEMLSLSDHVIFLSESERKALERTGGDLSSASLVRNAVRGDRFCSATGTLAYTRLGFEQYVLCVGRVEHRKNQLLLATAMRGMGIPLVLLGACKSEKYKKRIQAAGDFVHFIGVAGQDDELLPSLYAGSTVFALPSFAEGAPLAALEAGAAGVPLVLGNRTGESEYFGATAEYCNPLDPKSIRLAINRAMENDTPANREKRTNLVLGSYSWRKSVLETSHAYQLAIHKGDSSAR